MSAAGEGAEAAGSGSGAAASAHSARTTTTVRAGETLDRIIRRTLGNLPFKESLLRAAFVEANPRTYPNGNIQRLPAGTPLNVPSAADLRRLLLRSLGPEWAAGLRGAALPDADGSGRSPIAARPASAAAEPVAPAAAPAASRPDHRGWVRFP